MKGSRLSLALAYAIAAEVERTHMSRASLIAGLCAFALCLTLAGCGGGGADVENKTRSTTTGQELLDLQKAKEAGVISESEYNKQRSIILNRKD